ncbi:hypothetical protein COEX109129_40115 [Corallococcus exiguus]
MARAGVPGMFSRRGSRVYAGGGMSVGAGAGVGRWTARAVVTGPAEVFRRSGSRVYAGGGMSAGSGSRAAAGRAAAGTGSWATLRASCSTMSTVIDSSSGGGGGGGVSAPACWATDAASCTKRGVSGWR